MPSFSGGGAERVMLNVAEGLLNAGFKVEILVLRNDGAFANEVPPGVTVIDLKAKHARSALLPAIRYLRSAASPDLIFTNLPHIDALITLGAKLACYNRPIIPVLHNTFSIQFKRLPWHKRHLVKACASWVLRRAKTIVAVSDGVRQDAAAQLNLAPTKIRVIYNPVFTPKLKGLAALPFTHAWLTTPRSVPVICAVGRLTAQKDFPTLLKAVAKVRESRPLRLLILGEGPDRADLEELARKSNIEDSVALTGFLSNPHACVARCDGLVMSSLWEGFGNVLVEALTVGTPIASTDCPSGPKEILEDGKWGYLAKPGDAQSIADAIAGLIDAPKPTPPVSVLEKYGLRAATESYIAVAHACLARTAPSKESQ